MDLKLKSNKLELIEFIIQLEDENNELKFDDIRHIATKFTPEERKKIMTLDNYLDRHLKKYNMSKTDFLKDHFLLITRIFDKRVHDFMQTVMKKAGIKEYSFRVEFQLRGLPHIHGAGWLEMTKEQRKKLLNKDGSFKIFRSTQDGTKKDDSKRKDSFRKR